MRIIEILTDILFYPFANETFDIYDLSSEDPRIVKVKTFYILNFFYY